MRIVQFISIIICIWVIGMLGCSNGGQSPVDPTDISTVIPNSNPIFVSDWDLNGNPVGGMGALGLFELMVDPVNESVELTPLRSSSITDALEIIDITNFMEIFPCVDCVHIRSFGINSDGHLVMNLGIKHPFDAGNPADPITGKNRADLHVFNVEGIIVSNLTGEVFGGLSEMAPGFRLVNADGYTDYLDTPLDNIFLTFATIHPYITHFANYTQGNFAASNPMGFASVVDPPPLGNLVMAMGADYNYEDYVLDMGNQQMQYLFVVACTYAVTTNTFEDRFTPEYRVPQHNKKAASEVSVSFTNNNLYGGVTNSTADIVIEVVDISHGVAVGGALDQMFADSSVDEIIVDIPAVMTSTLTIAGSASTGGSGHSPGDPVVYQDTVTNTQGAGQGTYLGLVKVIDSYAPGQNTHPYIGVNDGGERVPIGTSPLEGLFEIDEFATYQVFTVDVGEEPNLPPVAALTRDPDFPTMIQYEMVELDGRDSEDTDGTIVSYEFDFNWDGVPANFNVDQTSALGRLDYMLVDSGDITIGLRVTDNDAAVDYATVDITVTPRNVIFVDDDNTAGPWDGSYDNPFQYVQDGVDAASNDTTVWIMPGMYNEDPGGDPTSEEAQVYVNGVSDLYIYGEGAPQIILHEYTGGVDLAGIHAVGCLNLIVEGIAFNSEGGYQAAVSLDECSNAIVQDCAIALGSSGFMGFVYGVDCDGAIVQNNVLFNPSTEFSAGNVDSHLVWFQSSTDVVITLNRFTGFSNDTVALPDIYMSFIRLEDACTGAEISKNRMGQSTVDVDGSCFVRAIYLDGGCDNTVIRNNLIYQITVDNDNASGEVNFHGIETYASADVEIYNNTMDRLTADSSDDVVRGFYIYENTGADIYNNIVTNLTSSDNCYGMHRFGGDALTVDYCDVWTVNGTIAARYQDITEGGNGLDADPEYTGAIPLGDYHLDLTSPCRRAGRDSADMGCYGGGDPLPD